MSDTLREILADAPNWPTARARIEAWAYGEEKECPNCHGAGVDWDIRRGGQMSRICPVCVDGKVKTPGLVDRVLDRKNSIMDDDLMDPEFITAISEELAPGAQDAAP